MNLNKEKVKQDAAKIQMALRMRHYTADETVALLKTLQHLMVVQCIKQDLVLVSLKRMKEVGIDESKAVEMMNEATGVNING